MRPFRKPKAQNQNLTFPNIAGESNQASKDTHNHTKPVHPSGATDPAPAEKLTGLLQPGTFGEKREKFDPKRIADRAMKKCPSKNWHAPFDSGQHDVLTEKDVAELLDCETSTVQEKARAGELPGLKFGRSWIFPRSALMQSLHQSAMQSRIPKRLPNDGAFGYSTFSATPKRGRVPPPLPPL